MKWSKGPDGTWLRGVPLSREAVSIIRKQEREFVELFGRKMRDDLVFFDVVALTSEELMADLMDSVMRKADIRPEIAYASRKTGLIVTAENMPYLTGQDLREWQEAIDEYYRKGDVESDEERVLGQVIELIVSEFRRCMVVMGLAMQRGGPLRVSSDYALASGHTFFCLAKAIKSMQAIQLLTDERFGEDGLILVRSVFEGYLHSAYLFAHPTKADDLVIAKLGLESGTHEYRRTSTGRPDYSIIIEKATGRTFEGKISFRTMAYGSAISEDANVYEAVYEFLSGFSHPNFAQARTYSSLENRTYEHTKRSMYMEARALALIVGTMFIHLVYESGYLSKAMTRDLHYYLFRTRKKLLSLFETSFPPALVDPLRARVQRFPAVFTEQSEVS